MEAGGWKFIADVKHLKFGMFFKIKVKLKKTEIIYSTIVTSCFLLPASNL